MANYYRNDRYDELRVCIGDDICQRLSKLKLFMVSKSSGGGAQPPRLRHSPACDDRTG